MSPTLDLSSDVPALSPARRAWWVPVLVWTGAVVLYAIVLHLEIHLPVAIAFESSAVYLYSLAVLTIPANRWSRQRLAEGRPSMGRLAGQIAIGLVTLAAWMGVNMLYERVTLGPDFWRIVYADNFLFQLLFSVTIYGMVLGVTLTTQAWEREQARERREAALTILAREAQLGTLKAQFQPHFVLNALNSLLALIDRDPALARTMVVRLADVMKAVFDRIDVPAVPLDRELELVQAYLDVERIRFGDRLTVSVEADAAARQVLVPPFLLQPIVENAIKHGIAPYARPGVVRIAARVHGGGLEVHVDDSGSGAAARSDLGTGQGLHITRRRLETSYGANYSLALDRTERGTSVRLMLPAAGDPGHAF